MSTRMKKLLALGTVMVMSLTGCGSSNEVVNTETTSTANEVVTLKVWGSEDDQALLNHLVESFKQEYSNEATFDITVEIENEATCKDRILSDVGQTADVFTFIDDQLMSLAASGVIEPIIYQEEVSTNNLEGAVEAATLNDEVYAYPLTADNGYFMYYNSNYFTETDVQTLDQMLAIAEKNNKKVAMDWSSGWYLYSFFGNTGLELGLEEDYVTNYCTWNATEGAIKGVDVVDAMLKIANSNGFTSLIDTEIVEGVKNGSIIACVSGVWNALPFEEAWQDGYNAVKLPTYTVANNQVQMASYAGYKMMGVNSHSKEKEWAQELAHYLTNEESQIERFAQRGQGGSNINASNTEEVKASRAINAVISQSEYGNLQRVGEMYWQPSSELGQTLASGNLGGKTKQSLLDDIVSQITINTMAE